MPAVPEVERFIRDHVNAVSAGEIDAVADGYASDFLEATPLVHAVRTADAQYRRILRERDEFLRSIGFRSANLTAIESTGLDANYVLARASLRMVLAQGDDLIEAHVDRSYLVSTIGGGFRILCQILHADEDDQLRVVGIID
jgi:ketosteroid isomerase-like protein